MWGQSSGTSPRTNCCYAKRVRTTKDSRSLLQYHYPSHGVRKMKRMLKAIRGSMVALACLGLLLPRLAFGATSVPTDRESPVIDIALGDGGVLLGRVVDAQGAAVSGTTVSLQQGGQEVKRTQTDDQGRFAVTGLRGGVSQIVTAQGGGVLRLWASQTAPPSAEHAALVVSGNGVVRGQFGGGLLGFLANPWVIAAVVAVAVAVPLALDRDSGS